MKGFFIGLVGSDGVQQQSSQIGLGNHILLLGDSILAQMQHTAAYPSPGTQPPGYTTQNLADKIRAYFETSGTSYLRYEQTGADENPGSGWTPFTGLDSFRVTEGQYINNASANTSTTIPGGSRYFAWIGNFRTINASLCTVSINEGNDRVEVWNGSSWIEANGYTFDHSSTNIGGGDIWYCRVYFRKVESNTSANLITITKDASTDEINYWGWEHNGNPINVIFNEARSSHPLFTGTSDATALTQEGLADFQDRAFSSKKPSPRLIVLEIPIINILHHYRGLNPTQVWDRVNDFCFSSNSYSLSSKTNGFQNTQLLIFTAHLSTLSTDGSGNILTRVADDTNTYSKKDYHDEIITQLNGLGYGFMQVIDLHQQFYDYGIGNYADYDQALSALTSDGIHLNDSGVNEYMNILQAALNQYNF